MTVEQLYNELGKYMEQGLAKHHVQVATHDFVSPYIQPAVTIHHSFVGKNMDRHKVFLVPTNAITKL